MWRVVEAQPISATRKLVDSDPSQKLLEDLLERNQPAQPKDVAHLHYLLARPFRYPPLRHGSRFGNKCERGIWYGSETLKTSLAEAAFCRLLFLEGSSAKLDPLFVELTAFQAEIDTSKGADLTASPFLAHQQQLSDNSSHRQTQELGSALRHAGVQALRYRSTRDPNGGIHMAVLNAAAFSLPRPHANVESWQAVISRERIECSKRDIFESYGFVFERASFEVGGKLPPLF